MLFDIEETSDLANPIYFSAGFEGVAVEIYKETDEAYGNLEKDGLAEIYFVVKKYSTSHLAGFQSLYIGSVHRTARLENENLTIYRIHFVFSPEDAMILGYDLVFEKKVGIWDLEVP